MPKRTDIFKLILKKSLVMKDLSLNMTSETDKKPFISFNNAIIIALIILISFMSVLLLNDSSLKIVFSDLISPIIAILVALSLFYAAKISGKQHRRVQIAWMILGIAVLFYVMGDIMWAFMELILHQQPFPSVADVFYLSFYPLFALGVYYLPKVSFSRNEEFKLVIDATILILTVGIILWTFLIMPTLNSNDDLIGSIISITYIIGDIVLLFALIRIVFSNFKNTYREPLILLGLAIITQIISDIVYSYQSLHGTYISGGILDVGWILSFIFIWLAAILQTNIVCYGEHIKFVSWMQNFSFPSNLPIFGVAIAYILLVWTDYNLVFPDSMYIEIGVGVVIFLLLIRQLITLNENKGLYLAAKKEIDNRKMVEGDLKENQRTLETLISNLPGMAYKCKNDPQWTMEFVSEGCFELTGYQPEDLILNKKISYNDIIHPDDRQMVQNRVQKALNENKSFKMNYRIITADSKEKIVWEQGRGVFSDKKDLMALEGFITDITRRKKAEEATKKSESYYRTIFENTGTATLIFGEDNIISLANTECEKLSGYIKEEIEGKKSWIDFVAEEDREKLINIDKLRKADPDHAPKNYEFKLVNKHGDIHDVYANIALIPYTDNRLVSLLDITDRKKAEKTILESEAKYKDLAELLPQTVFESDLNGNITFANRIGLDIFGYTQEDLDNGLNMMQIIASEDHERAKEDTQKSLSKGELTAKEYIAIKKDNTKFPIIVYADSIIHENQILGLRGVIIDITEIKQAEQKIKNSLNEKELLLKEIHHRVKNNMQIISSLLSLQLTYADDNQAIEVLKESQGRIKSMALVHENLYLSRTLTSINFKEYIQKLVIDITYSYNASFINLRPNIEDINLNIETTVPCGLIVNELVTNSIKHAFPENKGTIIIQFTKNNDKLMLIVRDDGIGLPESFRFSDNKSLGLQLVQTLVKQLDGEMKIDRANGTTFTIIFKELEYEKRI